ncbi:MAG: prolyl oligopeptidase family serine peptidase [Bdellovibrionota bacterium]|nr:prolyl oligopeptidase family serine peptidase [Bdellovibrionota bacterium]
MKNLIYYSIVLMVLSLIQVQAFAKALVQPWPQMTVNDIKLHEIKTKKHYSFYEESGTTLVNEREVNFGALIYKSHSPLNRLVIITPNIRGVTVLERRLAHYLSKRGFHVVVPILENKLMNRDNFTYEAIDNSQRDFLYVTRSLVDHYQKKMSFDEKRIGLAGVSLGGIRSSLLLGSDDIFRAMYISVAGAELPEIYANSQHEFVRELRNRHMKNLEIDSVKEYEALLEENLSLDVDRVINSPYLDNVAMIIADDDKIVPSVNQWKLWETLKEAGHQPKTIIKDCEHIMGALYLLRYQRNVYLWLKEKLSV